MKICPNCDDISLIKISKEYFECPQCHFNYSPNVKKIEKVYMWLSVDPVTDLEGMIAIPMNGMPMPAIHSDLEIILKLKEKVVSACKSMGMHTRLVEFTRTEVKKEIK